MGIPATYVDKYFQSRNCAQLDPGHALTTIIPIHSTHLVPTRWPSLSPVPPPLAPAGDRQTKCRGPRDPAEGFVSVSFRCVALRGARGANSEERSGRGRGRTVLGVRRECGCV